MLLIIYPASSAQKGLQQVIPYVPFSITSAEIEQEQRGWRGELQPRCKGRSNIALKL